MRQRRRWWLAAAAAASVAVAGLLQLAGSDRAEPGVAVAEFATRTGETVTVTLTDGTFVRLAPNSRLRMAPFGNQREVWLDGRAFFAVHADSLRPFTVHTTAGDALVRGTRFDLRVQQQDLRLTVVEGRVALAAGSKQVEVNAGEVSHVRKGEPPAVLRVKDTAHLIDWPGGALIFQATPLEQIARELERHFGVAFVIADPKVADRAVTAWFTDETLDEVVTAVCRAVAARCTIEEQRVLVGA